ncbi:hypothetical protein D9619_007360 [Psilocybe cf. subviscida]|uniref:RNA-binding protein VTS1 n=1 Tax=Psilocybe cf. subviscida TaxID=2480587 RepID=A0A8H5B2H8_9AGAR|nr:hypothetical protein D9619_007360 [Psilocybe cf. subviscida]
MSLRPPTTPSPGPQENGKANARQSMGPSSRGTPTLAPASPRPGGQPSARPASELLGSGTMFQTPEAEALDLWFENLQNYEATLEEMAAASLDVNFKEELSAIEQWFKVLSEAERTAALYSLLQHSTQVQIRFFITVLQQMARSDPMTALLSPAPGGSMQSQMESKLAQLSLKSPGLKSGLPSSPTARNFTPGNRQSMVLDNTNYLSPESAANAPDSAAATLAQQRAKLKASNAAHRISAPVLASPSGGDGRASWGPSTLLSQVSEQQASPPEASSRPKSTEFSGTITPRGNSNNEVTAPANDSWASMVNTPLIPMFAKETRPAPAAEKPKTDWHQNPGPGVPRMGDPTIHRRNPKNQERNNNDNGAVMYDDNGNPISNIGQGQAPNAGRTGPGSRNVSGNGAGWSGTRSPVLNNQPNRFGDGSDAGSNMNGLGMQMNAFGMGLSSPTMGMPMPGLGMQPMGYNMNMLMSPEVNQLLAAQIAAGQFQPGGGAWMGMQPMSAGLNSAMSGSFRKGPNSARSPPLRSAGMMSNGGNSTPKGEEDVDPALLQDVAAWLRSLRLHKYTPNFEGTKWQDMVMMDEAALEAKGVAALGARRKMLKTFELVRKKMGMEEPPASAAA